MFALFNFTVNMIMYPEFGGANIVYSIKLFVCVENIKLGGTTFAKP